MGILGISVIHSQAHRLLRHRACRNIVVHTSFDPQVGCSLMVDALSSNLTCCSKATSIISARHHCLSLLNTTPQNPSVTSISLSTLLSKPLPGHACSQQLQQGIEGCDSIPTATPIRILRTFITFFSPVHSSTYITSTPLMLQLHACCWFLRQGCRQSRLPSRCCYPAGQHSHSPY